MWWRGKGGGQETREKKGGDRRCTGDGRRGDGKPDSQDGGKWEKKGKIMQHCAIFCNRKNANKYRAETGIKEYEKEEVYTPLSPPVPPVW